MRILLSYFSRTGHTERLARAIGAALQARGHTLEWEVITPAVHYSWTREVARDFPRYASILLGLASPRTCAWSPCVIRRAYRWR